MKPEVADGGMSSGLEASAREDPQYLYYILPIHTERPLNKPMKLTVALAPAAYRQDVKQNNCSVQFSGF